MTLENLTKISASLAITTTLLLFALQTRPTLTQAWMVKETRYKHCYQPGGLGTPGTPNSIARTKLECLVQCSESSLCSGVVVCPLEGVGRRVTCEQRLGGGGNIQCDNDTVAAVENGACQFMFKVGYEEPLTTAPPTTTTTPTTTPTPPTPPPPTTTAAGPTTQSEPATTTEPWCANGGTFSIGLQACQCLMPFAGPHCSRYIRDCQEPLDHGYTTSQQYEEHFIQPYGASTSFKAICNFQFSVGLLLPLWHNGNENWAAKTWANVRDGFNCLPSSGYFIGLERMRQMTLQAQYALGLGVLYSGNEASIQYKNFSLTDESTQYRANYSSVAAVENIIKQPADNGFIGPGPFPFLTTDRDINGCAASRGSPGWFDAGACTGQTVFGNPLVWTVVTKVKTLNYAIMGFIRESAYYAAPEANFYIQ